MMWLFWIVLGVFFLVWLGIPIVKTTILIVKIAILIVIIAIPIVVGLAIYQKLFGYGHVNDHDSKCDSYDDSYDDHRDYDPSDNKPVSHRGYGSHHGGICSIDEDGTINNCDGTTSQHKG